MWEGIFFYTGFVVWFMFTCMVALLIARLAWDAFISAWHVARVYRQGIITSREISWWRTLLIPFRTWLWFFLSAPRYVERTDGKGGRIYRPGRKPKREPEYYPG